MSKSKITSDDFLNIINENENQLDVAFHPNINQAIYHRLETIEKLKQKGIDEKKKLEAEKHLIKDGVFCEWLESFSEEERKRLAHPMNQSQMLIRSALRSKFETEVWPQRKVELGFE
jgi:hypothetical protein